MHGLSLSERLTHAIIESIRAENMTPGTALPSARVLAERFEVTIPTIRESLRYLEATGAVEMRHGSGTYVGTEIDRRIMRNPYYSPDDLESVVELLDARIAIEPGIAALAAIRREDASLDTLNAALDHALSAQAPVSPGHFHKQLALASHNRALHEMLEALLLLRSNAQQAARIRYDRVRDHQEHVNIVDSIRRGDPVEASHRTEQHLRNIKDFVIEGWAK